jgi:hypothetical protein
MRHKGLKTIFSRQFCIRFNPPLAGRINLLFELYFGSYDKKQHHRPGYKEPSQINTAGSILKKEAVSRYKYSSK